MPNLRRTLLTLGIGACLLGGALITIGSLSGGVRDLLHSSANEFKTTKKEESYQAIQSLQIDLAARNLVIQESPDDQAHLTYHQSDSYQVDGRTLGKITVTNENGSLKIEEEKNQNLILFNSGLRSLLSLFDQQSNEKRTVLLTLPKGSKLEQLKGKVSLGDVSLSNLSIKQSDFTLSNGELEVTDSQIEAGSIKNSLGQISLSKSQLTSGKLETQMGNIRLNHSKIADSEIHLSNGSLDSEQLELAGTISITNHLGDINLQLVAGSISTTSFDLETQLGNINIPDNMQVDYRGGNEVTGGSISRKAENPQADLTVKNQNGNIRLSE